MRPRAPGLINSLYYKVLQFEGHASCPRVMPPRNAAASWRRRAALAGGGLPAKFQKNEVGMTIEVMSFLKHWLYKHILETDKNYTPHLNAQGVR
jgi:hypothetical protein